MQHIVFGEYGKGISLSDIQVKSHLHSLFRLDCWQRETLSLQEYEETMEVAFASCIYTLTYCLSLLMDKIDFGVLQNLLSHQFCLSYFQLSGFFPCPPDSNKSLTSRA